MTYKPQEGPLKKLCAISLVTWKYEVAYIFVSEAQKHHQAHLLTENIFKSNTLMKFHKMPFLYASHNN